MNNFKKGGFRKGNGAFGDRPRFGGGNKFGGGSRSSDRSHGPMGDGRERELFKAKCSACFQACEVPFKPTNGKPVFCKDCFADNAPRREERGGSFRHDAPRERNDRPAYREEARPQREQGNEDVKRQLMNLEAKVNQILELLTSNTSAKVVSVPAKRSETEMVKEDAPKKVAAKPKTVKAKVAKAPTKVAKKKVATKKSK